MRHIGDFLCKLRTRIRGSQSQLIFLMAIKSTIEAQRNFKEKCVHGQTDTLIPYLGVSIYF